MIGLCEVQVSYNEGYFLLPKYSICICIYNGILTEFLLHLILEVENPAHCFDGVAVVYAMHGMGKCSQENHLGIMSSIHAIASYPVLNLYMCNDISCRLESILETNSVMKY